MSEQRYYVHVQQFWTYEVTAESPEAAEQIVIEGDGPHGECTGWTTESVTADDDPCSTDLRASLRILVPGSTRKQAS